LRTTEETPLWTVVHKAAKWILVIAESFRGISFYSGNAVKALLMTKRRSCTEVWGVPLACFQCTARRTALAL